MAVVTQSSILFLRNAAESFAARRTLYEGHVARFAELCCWNPADGSWSRRGLTVEPGTLDFRVATYASQGLTWELIHNILGQDAVTKLRMAVRPTHIFTVEAIEAAGRDPQGGSPPPGGNLAEVRPKVPE